MQGVTSSHGGLSPTATQLTFGAACDFLSTGYYEFPPLEEVSCIFQLCLLHLYASHIKAMSLLQHLYHAFDLPNRFSLNFTGPPLVSPGIYTVESTVSVAPLYLAPKNDSFRKDYLGRESLVR